MNRTSSEGSEERDFNDALGVDFSKTGHDFSKHSVHFFVMYMPVAPVYAVLR